MAEFRLLPQLASLPRYLRLYVCFVKYSLIREMSFRLHFVLRCVIHIVWIGIYFAFLQGLLLHAKQIGDWDKRSFLVFQGTYLLLNSLVNGLFLNNAADLAGRIRTGDLDTALVKPVDEQFLLMCQRVDWALLPQVAAGLALIVKTTMQTPEPWTALDGLAYAMLVGGGVLILYSSVVILASAAFWLPSREGLFDLWFAIMEVIRVPSDTLTQNLPLLPARLALYCALPIVLAVNVPARVGARLVTNPWEIGLFCLAGVGGFVLARYVFHRGLAAYRSASS